MLFSSLTFLWIFLPIVVAGNTLLKGKASNLFLLAASLLFYAWGEPVYILLMLISIAINWSSGMLIDRTSPGGKKGLLAINVALNLGLLGYFKYYMFLTDAVNGLLHAAVLPVREIPLPIGISFFTFQALSYVIDLYRGHCRLQRNPLDLALYISFFPQLIAGPIVRYHDIDRQIRERTVTREKFALGMRRFLYGLGKKIIIANTMAAVADSIFMLSMDELTWGIAWLGAITYTFQIYFDFSGYSDMAIGLGKIFGFDFSENFNYPYLSRSVQEFWQRWHISLGTWFREYLYIPLGGNRKGMRRTIVNVLIVFLLTGFWHGANWTFLVWGGYHGVLQILERAGWNKVLKKHAVLAHAYCILAFVFGWVLFRADSIDFAIRMVVHMLLPWRYAWVIAADQYLSPKVILILAAALIGCGPVQRLFRIDRLSGIAEKWKYSWVELVFLACVFLFCVYSLYCGTYNPFIYFRF